ncbi:transporter [Hyalangium rubrum]|uniref:Transporter n=1 Tax=Hyalangium rubrum TaxID=3103134 RepID=A0ABU5GW97_9BACT|nr:transporter [Hyalangium sp. s54d21]MDY7225454.1 transporter [Hyalangium sp. s54d21]
MVKTCTAALAAALLLVAPAAFACATCACGDPTLTSMGTEQPFAGRLRLAATMRAWGMTTGDATLDAVTLRELRMDVAASYAPLRWLFLSATLPLQARGVRNVSLASERSWGPGDLEVSAKAFVFRDREFSPDHLIAILVGAELPTSPTVHDAEGRPLSLDAQLGTGSWDPFAGLAYTMFRGEWSFIASATGYLPTRGRMGFRGGASLRSTLAAQYQPTPRWALRLAADTRLEAASDLLGVPDPAGKGFIGFLSPDVLYSPTTDVVVQLGVRAPILNLLSGPVRQTPILQAAVAYDL